MLGIEHSFICDASQCLWKFVCSPCEFLLSKLYRIVVILNELCSRYNFLYLPNPVLAGFLRQNLICIPSTLQISFGLCSLQQQMLSASLVLIVRTKQIEFILSDHRTWHVRIVSSAIPDIFMKLNTVFHTNFFVYNRDGRRNGVLASRLKFGTARASTSATSILFWRTDVHQIMRLNNYTGLQMKYLVNFL